MLALIARIHRNLGIAVVISSHILEDIERVCDYVTILNAGRLVLAEPMSAIGTGATELIVRVEGNPGPFRAALEQAGLSSRMAEDDALVPGEFVVPMDGEHVYDLIRDVAAERGDAIRTLRPLARTLEDVYLGNVEAAEAEREAASAASQ
jgi:ABC-2 type transport system ATP-binding protein